MLKPVLVGCLFACSLSLASGCSDPDPDAPPPVAPEPARPPPTVDEDPNLEALDLSGTRVHEALIETLLELNPNSDIPYSRMGALALRELEFGQLLRPFDFTTQLDRVDIEVLFMAGGDSDTLGAAQQERQRAYFPRSRLEVIEGADHNGLTRARVDAVIPRLVSYFAESEP